MALWPFGSHFSLGLVSFSANHHPPKGRSNTSENQCNYNLASSWWVPASPPRRTPLGQHGAVATPPPPPGHHPLPWPAAWGGSAFAEALGVGAALVLGRRGHVVHHSKTAFRLESTRQDHLFPLLVLVRGVVAKPKPSLVLVAPVGECRSVGVQRDGLAVRHRRRLGLCRGSADRLRAKGVRVPVWGLGRPGAGHVGVGVWRHPRIDEGAGRVNFAEAVGAPRTSSAQEQRRSGNMAVSPKWNPQR